MLSCMTRMAVMTTMIENTPTRMPSNVKPERSLCTASAFNAIQRLSRNSTPTCVSRLFIAECIHWIHARRAPGWKEARIHPGQERDQDGHGHNGPGHVRRQETLQCKGQRKGYGQPEQTAEKADARRFR